MTTYERNLLDNNLKNFDSFIEFHKFLFSHDIELSHEEWELYRDKLFAIFKINVFKNKEETIIDIDTFGLVLP